MSRVAACAAGLVLLLAGSLHAVQGDPVGGQFQVNTYETEAQSAPFVAPDPGGGFVVVWQSFGSGGTDTDSGSVQARRYDATGAPRGAQFQVNTFTTGSQREPEVAAYAAGFVVVWQGNGSSGTDTSNNSIHGQRYDAAGGTIGGEFQVNTYTTGGQYSPAIAADGAGGFVVVWNSEGSPGTDTSDTCIRARRFDAAGQPDGGDFQVNTYTSDAQSNAAVGADGSGGFVVVWASDGSEGTDTSNLSVQGRRFDAGGNPAGGQFQVNTYTTSVQAYPAAGATGGGGFVVVWQSEGSATDPSSSSVQLQRYDAAGLPAGGEVQVNTYTTLTQDLPRVGLDGAGGFLVLWESAGSGGGDQSGFSAQAQRFDGAGAPVGGEFQVNTYGTSEQQPYAACPDGGGGFVVVWDSLGSATDDEGRSIQAQRYAGPDATTTTTSTTLVGASTTTSTTTSASSTTTVTAPFGAEALAGQALQLRARSGRPEKTRLALRSRDRSLTLGRGNESPDDPVVHGGALVLSSAAGGFATTHPLAGAWRYLGAAGRNKGYRWTSATAPIRTVVVKRGKLLKVAGRGAGLGFDLDDNPDAVRLALGLGGHLYCLEFGGAAAFTPGRRFVAKTAGAPGVCP